VAKQKDGRRNRYQFQAHLPLPEPASQAPAIGGVLALLAGAGARLQIGAIRAGVLGPYRERPGPLTAFQLGDALIFADTATVLLLAAQDQAGGDLAALAGPGGRAHGPGIAPGRDRPGRRDAHRAARRRHRGCIRAAARLCLCT
jgi:hypothetical protein